MKSKRRLKKPVKYAIVILLLLIGFLFIYKFETGSVSNKDSIIAFEVKEGSTFNSISSSLRSKNLIKSELFYKLYIKIHKPNNLQAGFYELNSNMNVKELVNALNGNAKSKMISVTFKEGITFDNVADIVSSKMNIKIDDIYGKLKDTKYIDSLINDYWFLTDDIKNENIYYSLEGYLFPDTYQFNEKTSIEEIFKIMLDNTKSKLDKYKSDIEKSKYSIHEIMTMASIVEKEASNSSDRAGVAGVFYNRLDSGMSLGSDVTTYYGLKLDLTERDLTVTDLNSYNGYNTRNASMAGKLPVGPICMPGLESIVASINPTNHDYIYFVADKTGKTYFTKTSSEHTNMVAKLKREGKWYEY
ncbi:MAG: endolytic transglycosylase MltG [Bacilli bacterium]|nr:endolytic transglycosylase MltG [Bacilli bacterium]